MVDRRARGQSAWLWYATCECVQRETTRTHLHEPFFMMNPRPMPGVGIIAAGARTALGRSLPATSAAVRARVGHVTAHPFLVDGLEEALNAARATWLPSHSNGSLRFVSLAANAAKEALWRILRVDSVSRLRVFVGLPEDRPGRPRDLDATMTRALGDSPFWGHRVDGVELVSQGHAAALMAMGRAVSSVENGECDLCLAGGVDSYLTVETMQWLNESRLLRAPANRWGFTPGEGAGFCVLASSRWMQERAIEAPLTISQVATADEPARIRTPTVCVGKGLSEVFEASLAPLREKGERALRLMGDLNGEPYRADELGFALARSSDAIVNLNDILAPAEYWGDVGAASGALFAGLAFDGATRGYDVGATLAWSSSEGGARAAAIFRATTSEESSR